MPISHTKGLIFVHIPKNAGTAITNSRDHAFIREGHHSARDYRQRFPELWGRYFSFAVVRNPWDRCVSNYEYARMERSHWHSPDGSTRYPTHPDFELLSRIDFEACVSSLTRSLVSFKHLGWRPQHSWICNWLGHIQVDQVFRYDRLDVEPGFTSLFPHLTKVNCSTRAFKDYRAYYNAKTRDAVYRLYRKDIRLFGFDF